MKTRKTHTRDHVQMEPSLAPKPSQLANWRNQLANVYVATCIFDFIIAPILWAILQSTLGVGAGIVQWNPLTLQGAGLYHMSMGAILGVSAWSRGQEKLQRIRNGVTGEQEKNILDKFKE